jgi:hypothetical protein
LGGKPIRFGAASGNLLDFAALEFRPHLVCVDCMGNWCATRNSVQTYYVGRLCRAGIWHA